MSKKTKRWLAAATCLVILGAIIIGGVMSVFDWDFMKFSSSKTYDAEFKISEEFKNVSIITETDNIVFVASDNGETSVLCKEQNNITHSVRVENDTLVIELEDTRKWYEHVSINFIMPKITVTLPAGEYGDLKIESSTGNTEISKDFKFQSIDIKQSTGNVKNYASTSGDIKIKTTTGGISLANLSADSLDLSASTGKVSLEGVSCENDLVIDITTGKTELSGVTCENLTSSGSTGKVVLEKVNANKKITIKRTTGDVKFNFCDAGELFIKTSTGDVTGSLITNKVFITSTSTGKIDVPKTTSGGTCEITTSTGNIKITVG